MINGTVSIHQLVNKTDPSHAAQNILYRLNGQTPPHPSPPHPPRPSTFCRFVLVGKTSSFHKYTRQERNLTNLDHMCLPAYPEGAHGKKKSIIVPVRLLYKREKGGEGAPFVSTPKIYPKPMQQGQNRSWRHPAGEGGFVGLVHAPVLLNALFTLTEILDYRWY